MYRPFQDFDEKRQEWRKQKKSVLNAITLMRSRTLRFEDSERRTIALCALDFYTVGGAYCVHADECFAYTLPAEVVRWVDRNDSRF